MDVVETMKKSCEAREIKNLMIDNDNDRLKELKDEMFLNDCKIISKIISCEDNYDDIIVTDNLKDYIDKEDPIKWSRFIFKKEFGEMIYKLYKLSRLGVGEIYYGENTNEWFKLVQTNPSNDVSSVVVELRIPLFGIYADPYLETSVTFDKILEFLEHPMAKIKDPAEKK